MISTTRNIVQAFYFIFCFGFILSSCNIINPAEDVPGYLRINKPEVIVKAGQGSASNNIYNAWLYLDNNSLGVYGAEGTFPIIASGNHLLISYAGIKNNGINGVRVVYPFYKPDTLFADFQPNQTIVFNPKYKYYDETVFDKTESFDNGSILVSDDSTNNIQYINDATLAFEGQCIRVKMDTGHHSFSLTTVESYTIPQDAYAAYIELNYKSDVTFQVGLQESNSPTVQFYKWNITPKSGWNKIYLDLKSVVYDLNGDAFKIVMRANYDSTKDSSFVYLDNLKLLHL